MDAISRLLTGLCVFILGTLFGGIAAFIALYLFCALISLLFWRSDLMFLMLFGSCLIPFAGVCAGGYAVNRVLNPKKIPGESSEP